MPTALPKRGLVVALAASLVSTVLTASPTPAVPYRPPAPSKERLIAGEKARPVSNEDVRTGTAFKGDAPVWPKASVAEVDLGAVEVNKSTRAADTPVSVIAAEASMSAAKAKPKVKIETFDREKTRAAGVDGMLFKVSGGEAKVEVDYSRFRWAYGGDWASRLRLVELPECALKTPERPECAAKPVASHNNTAKGTVIATDATPSSGAFMALAAGTSSGSGSYSATSLTSSATWSAGGNAGDFTWNYPLRTPPSLGGPTPSLALAYSSASVDGRMAASNNQPSWIGEGFELGANFIERKYVSCSDDMVDGARNTTKTGDLCWRNENATLSMQGHAGELIKEGPTSNRWRLRTDDGTRVEFRGGIDNGARNGEHWVVTTPDGVQHWFGRSRQSVLNVPVAGNHAKEPCEASAFKDSFCSQPYRWLLEYVVDLRDNTLTYSYDKETNKYARNNTATDLAEYDRGSVLKQIDYGTRKNGTDAAPMQVVFESADRCLADCGTKDAQHWPDVPWDQSCDKSPCLVGSPTFWMTKRLASVTTKVGGSPVEKWSFGHSFPDPGDGTRAGLWLDKVSRQGLVGETTTVPDIRFSGIQLSNRVDTHSDQHAAMKWWRLKTIHTETGGRVDVVYADADCAPGSRMPNQNALQDNNLRCYPVRWTPEGNQTPIWDYFHKYVVESVTESDLTGGSPRVITQYEYVGDPAWHYTDDDGLIKAEDKTWSVWRGYGAVKIRKGDPGEQLLTETRYFRGMQGDKLPSGTRAVPPLPAIEAGDVPETADEDAFAGMVREEIVYNGPNGAEVSATVNVPWRSDPTASRTINGITTHARYVATASKHSRTALDGGRGYRTTSTRTEFDQEYGMAVWSEDRGDDSITDDEKCSLADYARNTSTWLIGAVSRERGFLVDCAKALADTALADSDIATDTKTYYDGQDHGVAPTKGNVTKTEGLKSYVNGTADYLTAATSEFDDYGRLTKLTDLKGTTTTAYTPASGGPVTQTAITNPMGWVTTTTMQPAWALPTSVVDFNQRTTRIAYDGLGRVTGVWLPDNNNAQLPNKKFSYLTRTNAPTVVTTSVVNASGQYNASYQLLDGLLRPRQTQQPDASGATSFAVVADIYYDSAGRAVRINNPYLANVAPGTDRFVPTDAIPSATVTAYDGAGRETVQSLKKNLPVASPGGEELFRTTTYYAGDRTDVTPPAGGVATSTLTDALGRNSELRQYHAGVTAGSPTGYDATKYTYDLTGKLTKVAHPSGKIWEYSYDLRGRQFRAVDPDKGVTTSVYDDKDQLESITDARKKTLAYTYDALGRRTSTRDDSPTGVVRAEWFYDKLADGTQVNGQLVKTVRHGKHGAYIKEHTQIRGDYQPAATDFTIPEGETGLAGTFSYVYSYHDDGALASVRMPAVGDVKREGLEFGYDGLGQPKTQKTMYGTTAKTDLVADTGYTPFGELSTYRLRNSGIGGPVDLTRDYDQHTRRLNQIRTTKLTAPTKVADVSYDYDPSGNVTRISDSVSSDTQCFRTDYLRRMTEAWTPTSGDCAPDPSVAALGGPSKYWQSFSYNMAGDRRMLVEHGTSAGDRTTTYTTTPGKHSLASTLTSDNAGTRTTSYSYDDAGNTLTRPGPSGTAQTMTWDREGHIATTDDSGGTSYEYDVDGSRLIRRDPTGSTLYLPGQELRSTSDGAKTGTRYYTHAGQTIATRTSAGLTWMSSDHHGTAQNLINAKNQTVTTRRTLPFGEVRGGTGTWPSWMDKGFVGGTLDNTGLTHIGAREYDPAIGRFISVDPLMDTANPQQWNGYAYANNAPITFSDPTGLISCPDGDCQNKGPSGGGRGVPVRKPTTKNHGHGIVETRDRHGNVSINGYQLPAKAPSVERLVRGMIARINAEPAWAWAPDPDGQLDLIKTLKALESACFELAECDSAIEQMFFNHGATVTGIEYGMEFAGAPLGPIGGVGRRYNETNLAQAGIPFSKNIGPTPKVRNGHLAGKKHPVTGVPFDSDGYPDFSAWRHPDVPDVRITLTGDRKKDFAAANRAAGLKETPAGYTWHHHQDAGRMQLIDRGVHAKTGHTGGFAGR